MKRLRIKIAKWLAPELELPSNMRQEIFPYKPTEAHNIHFPEYRDKEGVLHLHSCPRGSWPTGCVENKKGDYSGAKQWKEKTPQ